jgi:4-aminobutyrate aminotransferase-like enzyme
VQEAGQKSAQDFIYYPVSDKRMTRGEGIYLYDEDGREFIDCASGTFNLSLGYSHPAVLTAMRDQAESLVHVTSSFLTDPVAAAARKLIEVSPSNLTTANLKVSSGSAANEGAIKMAQLATGKRDVLTLFRSHVGQTMMMTSMSGNAFRRSPFPNLFPGGLQVPDPYCFRCFYGQNRATCGTMCVDRIEQFLEFASSGKVAAIVVEPISGNGGNIVPPDGYFPRLRQFCDDNDIVLIFDEIQTGIGRTGYMFAAEYFGVQPDAITTAKGLGGSGAQVAAILASDRLRGLPAHHHSFTYGANLMAAAAASVTLDIIRRPEFLANVRTTGDYILARLNDMKERYSFIGDVRGVGLMIGFELVRPDGSEAVALTNHIAAEAVNHGLLLRTSRYGFGNVLKIRPPLILTMAQAEVICDRVDALLSEVDA